MEIFKIQNLTYFYPEKQEPAVKNINLTVNEGDFILLLGESGSGKSTLGRIFNGIVPEFYGGSISGQVDGNASEVGMVFQDPEKQLIMDNVEREIAFGLENRGMEYSLMKKRVMETLSFLNIGEIKNQNTYELSSGQKQKVAVGTTLAMGHPCIVFDEPTSQLDPAAAHEILHVIERLNKELGYTIILIEQRIDRCFHLADRIIFMKEGEIAFDGIPQNFTQWSKVNEFDFLPSVPGLFSLLEYKELPTTIKDGRKALKEIMGLKVAPQKERNFMAPSKVPVVTLEKASYEYRGGKQALKGMTLQFEENEIIGVMGPNGSGKSTLLKMIGGLLKPSSGKISIEAKVGYLSQNPNDYLFSDSVYEELKFTLDMNKIKKHDRIHRVLTDLKLNQFKDRNPRDLSGGEKQRVALASVLVSEPQIILLDEPTRGLDRKLKDALGKVIQSLQQDGKTIVIVTHDVEFVAKFCTKTCFIYDGAVVEMAPTYKALSSGIYYTTQMKKLFHGLSDQVLTIEDAMNFITECQRKTEEERLEILTKISNL